MAVLESFNKFDDEMVVHLNHGHAFSHDGLFTSIPMDDELEAFLD